MQISEDFDAFVAIVDAGSISGASRVLGLPRATLSRQLARLEERLGVRLLHRTTRSLIPTPAGEALYPRARSLLEAATATVEAVQRLDDVPRGLLRISAAPLHSTMLGELIGAFLERFPEVQVELLTSSRHIELASEQVDLALRGGVMRDPNLIARQLLRSQMLVVASPAYLERAGRPLNPSALEDHQCLRGFVGGARPATAWPLREGGKISIQGSFVSNDIMALKGAALAGVGLALLPHELVHDELIAGRLVTVLKDQVGIDVSLSLVWVERELLDPKIRAFVDLAVQWAALGRFS